MQRRTFESPMEWEYQGTGPVDATSPFSKLSRPSSQNIFASPSRPPSQNLFANRLATPSKQQGPAPPSSFFSPRIPGSQTAPAFRNPAFTTPRKPFDDLALSEASGAETSPALTEPSDCPNDTPELDRMSDLNMATLTPSRVDKALRYGKSGLISRRHAPGRGEIPRPGKEAFMVDHVRKRKRRNHDSRDLGGLRGNRHGAGWGDDSDDDNDTDNSAAGPSNGRSSRDNRRKRASAARAGWLGQVSSAMAANPDFAEQAHKLIRLSLHLILVGSFMFVGWKGYSAVQADISTANRAAQTTRLNTIAECTKQYQENQCVQNLPALRDLCEQWKNCMTDDPEAIFLVRNTIKEVASIINEFSGEMHLKSWGFFFLAIILLIISNRMAFQRIENPKPAVPHMAAPHYPGAAPPPWASHVQGDYLPWMHVQTPRSSRRRHMEVDDASETETDDGNGQTVFSRAIMAPPQTPSRRSPRKEDRERSPVKLGRSPTKLYR